MAKTKVAITLEKETVTLLDRLVKEAVFPSRSHGIQVDAGRKAGAYRTQPSRAPVSQSWIRYPPEVLRSCELFGRDFLDMLHFLLAYKSYTTTALRPSAVLKVS